MTEPEANFVQSCANKWRVRLYDISWFMRCINEPIARLANKEDGCTGRFWEGRFKSQALLDEQALLACMVYIDLNPVRAKIADLPEKSEHTSIYKRIKSFQKNEQPSCLIQFKESKNFDFDSDFIDYSLADYIELVDWTARHIRDDKRGFVDDKLPNILKRLQIEDYKWVSVTQNFSAFLFCKKLNLKGQSLVGLKEHIKQSLEKFHLKSALGIVNARFN